MDVIGELQTIVQNSGYSRAKLAAIIKEMMPKEKIPREHKEPSSPVTSYTSIERIYTCQHCKHSFSSIVKLKKREDTAVLVEGGSIMIINSDSPAKVECITSHCSFCIEFIQKLTREELEERYMLLLSQVSIVGRPILYGKKFTIEGMRGEEI